MTDYTKLSPLIEGQLPDFIHEEGENFVQFLKAYYEWMDQSNNAIAESRSLSSYRDIDTTLDKYISYFRDELLHSIPTNIVSDKRLLAKYIKDVYRAKGSENSYRLLFRILYDEEIEFYYPGDDILRASDGRWIEDKIIRVSGTNDIFNMEGYQITGSTSGATAVIERVYKKVISNIEVFELFLNSIDGDFVDLETITSTNDYTGTVEGVVSAIDIIDGGAYNQIGDSIAFSGLNATVASLNDMSAIEFYIVDGGTGYRANSTITLSGGSGTGASFAINTISNTEVLSLNTDIIAGAIDVEIDSGATFGDDPDANSSLLGANFLAANSASALSSALTYSNTTVGTISSLTLIDPGYGYRSVPSVSIVDVDIYANRISDGSGEFKGNNADVRARWANGAISSVAIPTTESGLGFAIGNTVSFTVSRSGAFGGTAQVTSKNGVFTDAGYWRGTNGFLSSDKYLQDNYYYQEYSYVLKVDREINDYRDIVKRLVHPAGVALFGEIAYTSDVDVNDTIDISTENIEKLISSEGITISKRASIPSEEIQYVNLFDTSTISSLQSHIISAYSDIRISSTETYSLVYGDENTDFESKLSKGTLITIQDTAGIEDDYQVTIKTVANNSLLEINGDYGKALANGSLIRVSPTIANTYLESYGSTTGTITLSSGNTTLVGTGTLFSTELSPFDTIIIQDNDSVVEDGQYIVSSISNDTSLTLNITPTVNISNGSVFVVV